MNLFGVVPGSLEYPSYIKEQVLVCLHEYEEGLKGSNHFIGLLRENERYKKLQNEHGRNFSSWQEFCLAPQPYGLGSPLLAMKAAWEEMTDVEKGEFLQYIGLGKEDEEE